MVAIKKALAHKSNYGSTRSTSSIKYIVIHYTANDGDHDESNAKYFQSPNRKASAHYFVDDDSITLSVPDNYVAWSVGGSKYSNCSSTGGGKFYGICTNSNSISIELCDTKKDGKYQVSTATRTNAIDLAAQLMKKYKIDINHVIRHFDVTGKNCPAYYVSDSKAWKQFKTDLNNKASGKADSPYPQVPFEITTLTDDVKIRKKPSKASLLVKKATKGEHIIVEVEKNWGKLKSGNGWIFLDNKEKIKIGKHKK